MELEVARSAMANYIKHEFGKLLELREVSIVRAAVGRVWSADIYCCTRHGDIRVGKLDIDDQGVILKDVTVDDVIAALRQVRLSAEPGESPFDEAEPKAIDEFSDFSFDDDDAADSGDDLRLSAFLNDGDPASIQAEVNALVATGDPQRLEEARDLLPRLLSEPDGRGHVLKQLGELEALGGERVLALNYLEAAAREFADKAELDALSHVAEVALQLMGAKDYGASTLNMLLERTRARLRPIESLDDAPVFIGLGDDDMMRLQRIGEEVSLRMGEDLMREGAPAIAAYIIKSGVLSIRIESPDGRSQVIRSCFPGDFVGESSVLGPPGSTCTASVSADSATTLWRFDGVALRRLLEVSDEVLVRVESAKTLHQLDSFMSMHAATSALDIQVRDQVLGCINGMRRFAEGDVLEAVGELPSCVYLVAEGQLEFVVNGAPGRLYETNSFAGLRDTLHGLPLEGDLVAKCDGLVITFEPIGLKQLAAGASAEVVATLERLE